MEYPVLGRTGSRVSRVGCGGGGIGQVWGLPPRQSPDGPSTVRGSWG